MIPPIIPCPHLNPPDDGDLAAVETTFAAVPLLTMSQAWLTSLELDFSPCEVRLGHGGGALLIDAMVEDRDIFNDVREFNSPLMAVVTQAALGPDVYLFNEQWVIKGPEQGMKFAWHQDSGYIGRQHPHAPYLTCWCTLDDVSEANGTVYLLPHSRGGTSHTIFDHKQEAGSNDLIGYTGSDPGDPIIAPAGSIVAFTSYNFHRSGANTTPRMRRIYLPQYSREPIHSNTGKLWAMATPFVKDGQLVYNRADDTAEKYGPK